MADQSRSVRSVASASDSRRRAVLVGFVALALLALGEAAPAAFPVHVVLDANGRRLSVRVDGSTARGP